MAAPIYPAPSMSERFFVALDAHEEVFLLRDLLGHMTFAYRRLEETDLSWDRSDGRYLLGQSTEDFDQGFVLTPKRHWYIEVSYTRKREAQEALAEALDRYGCAYDNLTLGRSGLLIGALPHFPSPNALRLHVTRTQPWWRRRRLDNTRARATRFAELPPTDPRYFPLNVPDPTAAITYWRSRAGTRH